VNNIVNSYCGPDPDWDSRNYDQEPSDGPGEIGLYDSYITPVLPHELNTQLGTRVARLINEGGNVVPQVKDTTPNRGVVNLTPPTEELVVRFGGGWEALEEG
jgi:hypothetical protein